MVYDVAKSLYVICRYKSTPNLCVIMQSNCCPAADNQIIIFPFSRGLHYEIYRLCSAVPTQLSILSCIVIDTDISAIQTAQKLTCRTNRIPKIHFIVIRVKRTCEL